ncbi:hypothetical protein [Glaciimonas sp. PAMC28666]|uniref:hypothetical protein n=1 Tax=Glaciimonas sp. PAMC28666 TaxID=2807626 RepID=UPI0019624955|nr:hypothetical protein [Glaciimonas sp. PAMC28666]QRX82636.1 hypothetical protein JQN73_21685 [Glaciimonas sp. PAMC28666]
MDAKSAVKIAKEYVLDMFADDNIENLGLEEICKDNKTEDWLVTVGFSRPWDSKAQGIIGAAIAVTNSARLFKIVRIDDATEQVLGITNREMK